MDSTAFEIRPIGRIRKAGANSILEVYRPFLAAMDGLDSFSHIHVLYWLHENDTPEKRSILQVHPRKNSRNPLTGVFATHSPVRPNPIALTLCRILRIDENLITVADIDARHNSPLLDIKCYIPPDAEDQKISVPHWVGRKT